MREQAAYEAKIKAREEKATKTGRKPRGRNPQAPTAGPGRKDQVNLTDEDSRIMPTPGGGFEQAYNAQATVATGSLLVVAGAVVQAATLEQVAFLHHPTPRPGRPGTILRCSASAL